MKQFSRQWYLKFDEVVTANGFKEKIVNQCIHMKVSGSKYIFLVLYVDDILLTANDTDLVVKTKHLLFSYFDKGYLGSILCFRHTDTLRRPSGIMRLSQQTYILNAF